MRRALDLSAPIVFVALLLSVWEIAVQALHTPPYLLPAPSAVAAAFEQNRAILIDSALTTLVMALWALAIASIAACAIALTVALSPLAERSVRPIAVALQVTPIVAIAPLVNIWAGLDHPQRAVIGLAAVVAFFPIFSGAVTGLKAADPDLERLFDLYGATRLQRLRRLRLPAAVPFLLEGHKVAAGLAVIGAVVAEFVSGSGGSQGLAWRLLEAANRLQTAKMFAALLILGLMGVAAHAAFQALETWALKEWRGR
ncbi:MAG: transporter permease [Caulobacteraceae bacterium]|jgi:NitT/TauT family transport system permease protein|nr:transporter permease [Caulobacteraceae bacterium]